MNTMRVKMLVALNGSAIGDEVVVPEDEAIRLFSARYAIPAAKPIERAIKKPVEKRRK